MENPITRVAEHQRRTLDFMLDRLGLRHARDEVVRRDRIAELETTVTALGAENRALRAEVQQLEQQLYPLEAEIAAFEREMATPTAPTCACGSTYSRRPSSRSCCATGPRATGRRTCGCSGWRQRCCARSRWGCSIRTRGGSARSARSRASAGRLGSGSRRNVT